MLELLTTAVETAGITSIVALALYVLRFLLIYLGVMLPAVWSRRQTRRDAATGLLKEVIDLIRRHRGP
ncbi:MULTISPECIES: hypothetical protein [Streptomyces]|uniref:hypothetical protein n=1 Tax=Streptomyces TaxID=1883 RepID=UPI002E27CF2D|nr:hypothetical protein [[Kitasatospora] papulosa]